MKRPFLLAVCVCMCVCVCVCVCVLQEVDGWSWDVIKNAANLSRLGSERSSKPLCEAAQWHFLLFHKHIQSPSYHCRQSDLLTNTDALLIWFLKLKCLTSFIPGVIKMFNDFPLWANGATQWCTHGGDDFYEDTFQVPRDQQHVSVSSTSCIFVISCLPSRSRILSKPARIFVKRMRMTQTSCQRSFLLSLCLWKDRRSHLRSGELPQTYRWFSYITSEGLCTANLLPRVRLLMSGESIQNAQTCPLQQHSHNLSPIISWIWLPASSSKMKLKLNSRHFDTSRDDEMNFAHKCEREVFFV